MIYIYSLLSVTAPNKYNFPDTMASCGTINIMK